MSDDLDLIEKLTAVATKSVDNDENLLKLCKAIIGVTKGLHESVRDLQSNVLTLQRRLMEQTQFMQQITEKMEILHEMYHTHFEDDDKGTVN